MKDFIAIDFETANECHSSVCSVGAGLVRDGRVTDRFWFCQQVHGLADAEACAAIAIAIL